IAGGIAAALTYAFIYQGATFDLGPVGFSTWAGVSVAEIVYTFVLCFVVLCVAVSERTKASHLFGLAIGSCVTVGGFAIGGISGGSLNPAVSQLGSGRSLQLVCTGALIYSALEVIGAAAAAGVFKVTHEADVAEEKTEKTEKAEFVGTFLLIFTVGCNVLGGSATWAGISIAFVLMVCIYALGGISGANFNPAVSMTLGMSRAMGGPGLDWQTVGIYCGVQSAAGVAAAVCYSLLFGQSFNLAPSKGFSWYHAGLCELLYTFMLTFVVMNVAAAKKNATEKNQYYGMAIAFTVVAGAYGAGAVSGGCFNPAVALGIDISSAGIGFGWSILYIIFELMGAAMAAALFKVVRPEDFGGEKSQVTELVSEFLGTYMLVLTVGLNVLGKSKAAAFSIAAGLTSMIYALGDVSGAHFNPAVTVAILASGRCPELTPAKAGTYAGAQIAGGIA
ncbi:unnamed protein product, partial [Effrenium voratum]